MGNASFRVPFPHAGEGRFLYFSLTDLAELEDAYGVGEVFGKVEDALQKNSAQVTMKCLEVALKREVNGKAVRCFDPASPEIVDKDGNESPIAAAYHPLLDALSQCHYGKTYDEVLEEAERLAQQALDGMKKGGEEADPDDPLAGPAASSGTSSSATGQG